MIKLMGVRILTSIPVLLGVVILVGMLIHLVPGDPADIILGELASLEDKQKLTAQLGLDQTWAMQLYHYVLRLFHGDLGVSLILKKNVILLIGERYPATVSLAICAMIWAVLLGIPMGMLSAVKSGSWIDQLAALFSLGGVALPSFFTGPVLIMIFSIYLGWLPVSERSDWQSYILPSITLGLAMAAILSRITRTSFLEIMHSDYLRTAKAKGLAPFKIVAKHGGKNASLPIITVIGLQFGVLLTGAVITEKIFDWPGLGSLFVEALNNRDFPLVQGCVLVFSLTYILINTFVDLLYMVIDPRVAIKS